MPRKGKLRRGSQRERRRGKGGDRVVKQQAARRQAPQLRQRRGGKSLGHKVLKTEGTVSAHRAGYGFVRSDELTESVFLPPGEMRGLMQGDRVRVAVRSDHQGRYSGSVLAVLERGVQAFLGTVERGYRGGLIVRAADRRFGAPCRVSVNEPGAEVGDWVIARLSRYPQDGEQGEALIERRLDPARPVDLATEAAIARFGLPVTFSEAALAEAKRYGKTIAANAAADRVDLRALPLVTIDGEDAKDFDDAVYAERLAEGGLRLIVAIADVSHYVRPGSALDREARERGTSVYFPTRVLPMLPTALSNHLCSLEPHVDRLCMVADLTISARGVIRQRRFYAAVMRSAARLTYTLAHQALFLGKPEARGLLGETLCEALQPLLEVYRVLAAARRRRGSLDFDAPETEFVIDNDQQVRSVHFVERNEAHRLIEECMIAANVAVAQEFGQRKLAALFRVHAPPDDKKLEQLRSTLRVLGMELTLSEPMHARDLGQVAHRTRDLHLRPFIETLVIRSLAQAVYQSDNIGHFGLALKDYTHFTSPIRRYPDLMVHRTLRVALGLSDGASLSSGDTLAADGADLSRLERRADEADRFVGTFLKCVYLRDRIGQTFDGLITSVLEFGCFVQLLDVGADGLLPLAALRDDVYQMARSGGEWIGTHSGRRLRPGSRLRVIVAAVHPVEGRIDLELAAQ
jgi:ribonuclease R